MPGFNWDGFLSYVPNIYLLGGVWTTVWLTVCAVLGGLLVGLLVALARLSTVHAFQVAARGYVWLFRGTPLLIQLVIIYTGLPQLGIRLSVVQSALLGLVLNEAAYMSEILRSGFLAVPRGQIEAAQSLGLNRVQTFWTVTAPQALRIVIPPLGNTVNSLLKATSITSVISMEELMRRSQMLIQVQFEVLEIFFVAAIYYLVLTSLWDVVQARLERRLSRGYAATRPIAPGKADHH
jgi:polar amino acid transport system permease protein